MKNCLQHSLLQMFTLNKIEHITGSTQFILFAKNLLHQAKNLSLWFGFQAFLLYLPIYFFIFAWSASPVS